jgi:hypothetical protein
MVYIENLVPKDHILRKINTYVVGLLYADKGANLLEPASWTKVNYSLLTSRSVPE